MSADEPAADYHLYLVRTARGALYTGITTDPARRLQQHADGRGARALRGKGPLQLAFSCTVGARSRALRVEAAVKQLDARAKRRIVSGELDPMTLLEPTDG